MKTSTTNIKACCKSCATKYEILGILGEGGQGTVFLCKDKATGSLVACKTSLAHYRTRGGSKLAGTVRNLLQGLAHHLHLHLDHHVQKKVHDGLGQDREIRHEIDMMRRVDVEGDTNYILPLHSTFESDDGFAHLVTPFCAEGSLFDMLKAIHEQTSSTSAGCEPQLLCNCEAATVIASLARALAFCHSRGIVHRDVKLQNVFLRRRTSTSTTSSSSYSSTTGRVAAASAPAAHTNRFEELGLDILLADLGIAAVVSGPHSLTEYAGTPMYIAPEVEHGHFYDHRADIWSLGILLHLLLTGLPLPLHGRPHLLVQEYQAWDLLLGMLSADPANRITLSQVLSHPWIVQHTSQTPPCRRDVQASTKPAASQLYDEGLKKVGVIHSCKRAIAQFWHTKQSPKVQVCL